MSSSNYQKLYHIKRTKPEKLDPTIQNGAQGRTRTGTVSLPVDFESTASTNFTTRAKNKYLILKMVPRAGLEPARYRYRWILSPLRLPISPPGHCLIIISKDRMSCKDFLKKPLKSGYFIKSKISFSLLDND